MIIVRYAKIPTELMDTLIPEGVKHSTVELPDGTTRQKTLREFVFTYLTYDLEDGTTLFRLACDESGRGFRYKRGTNEDDMFDWNSFMAAYGYGEATWLTYEEAQELIPKPEIG